MKDERIFRVTKQHYSGRTTTQYKSRTAISGMFGTTFGNPKRPDILKVEAVDQADLQWTDVTDEFRDKPEPKCKFHPTYTGVRKPAIWGYKQEGIRHFYTHCTCWSVYAEKHPEHPAHDPLCGQKHTDPEQCSCQILKRLTE